MLIGRQETILKLLEQNGYMEVTELASQLDVSVATIRRDLQILENQGKCFRKHGGVIAQNSGLMLEIPYDQKVMVSTEEKKKIAELALEMVDDQDVIILDAGSTVFELACRLNVRRNLTVVTNDIKTAIVLAAIPDIELYVPCGAVTPGVYSIVGIDTQDYYNTIHANKVFLGVDAIHADGSITNANVNETFLKRAMIKAGRKLIVLADSKKFSNNCFMTVCDFSQVDVLITDSNIKEESLRMLERFDVEVKIAKMENNN